MILVSIIVPVYNTEKYLEKCIKSLIDQTLQNIEIIAIDDGSKDQSGVLLDQFQIEYPEKIRVFHQQNSGISAVRNRGISLARGKYIAFVDSDDSVAPRYCELLVSKIEEDGLDMAVCDYFEVRGNNLKKIAMPSVGEATVYERPELLFYINTSPWNKLYDVDFLRSNQIEFPLNLKYEDTAFVHQILAKGAKIGCTNIPLVYYAIHAKSESTVVKKNIFDIFDILDIVQDAYRKMPDECYEKVYDYLEYFIINRITVYNLQQVYQEVTGLGEEFISCGFKYLADNFPKWRQNKYFNKYNGLVKRIIKKHIWITKTIVKIIKIFNSRGAA